MPSVDEVAASGAFGGLNPALQAGVALVSGNQSVTFTKYTRRVLPADGYVFWVKSSLLGDTDPPVQIFGSLHLASEKVQTENESLSRGAIVFTSDKRNASQGFDRVGPADILIGSVAGPDGGNPVRFAFSRLGFFQNAGLYHYSGIAILPTMASQIVDTSDGLDLVSPVASNSLPAWLRLSEYSPSLPAYGFGNPVPLFPAFLVPLNAAPPYGTINIPSETTAALAGSPWLSSRSSHFLLSRDRVIVTLFGVRDSGANDFLDCVLQYSQDYGYFGMASVPAIRDEKANQSELGIIAQKKSLTFEVNYNQGVMRDIARQSILRAVTSIGIRRPSKNGV